MFTIKVINSNGDELLYEATQVKHNKAQDVLEFADARGEAYAVDLSAGKRAYVMNSTGATVGSYV